MINDEKRRRSQIARLGAHSKWAACRDRSEATAKARAAAEARFEKIVDPDGTMTPAARAKAAEAARKAHFQRMALQSAKARRRHRGDG